MTTAQEQLTDRWTATWVRSARQSVATAPQIGDNHHIRKRTVVLVLQRSPRVKVANDSHPNFLEVRPAKHYEASSLTFRGFSQPTAHLDIR